MLLKIEIDRVKWNGSEKQNKTKQNYKYFLSQLNN